jgi:hypothetical protein
MLLVPLLTELEEQLAGQVVGRMNLSAEQLQ